MATHRDVLGFTTETLMEEEFEDRGRLVRLAAAARDGLSPLISALEEELATAVGAGDVRRVAKIAWGYGCLTAAMTEIETRFDPS